MQSVEEFRKNFDSVYYNKLLNIVEPFEKDYAEDELISYLSKHVPKKGKDLQYSIKVDHMLT